MVNKYEAIGIFVCVAMMALAIFLLRLDDHTRLFSGIDAQSQAASVVVSEDDGDEVLVHSLTEAMDTDGSVKNLLIDDVIIGEGNAVEEGDTVSVHYIGTLQNGQQFDNSYTRGEPFTFTVGNNQVIEGWEQGLIGMQKGGQRILVIPPELAYKNQTVGPIPANSTLVFAIELVDIK